MKREMTISFEYKTKTYQLDLYQDDIAILRSYGQILSEYCPYPTLDELRDDLEGDHE
jgi:hypothetical protein